MLGDLTTLANLTDWAFPGSTQPNGQTQRVMARLISEISGDILNELQRPPLVATSFVEERDGLDTGSIYLTNWPVLSVSQVVINGQIIPQSQLLNGSPTTDGWSLESWDGASPGNPQRVLLRGYRCHRGRRNVLITYTAGYQVQGEAQVVAGGAVTATAPMGPWAADNGVVYASTGVALVKVASAPAVGYYALGATPGAYILNTADNGAVVDLTYSYTPGALENACINLVTERLAKQGRIGIRSQAIGDGQSTTYDLSDLPAYVKRSLRAYLRLLPL